eukprot:CAMPEP_0202836294 /NCGR_PEP_ID=MMETSP1389-20130828/40644_1 /ASSEMBLY_ACC=CAM_ASM_000865 /TAXON_ID=302021 /ORGANISM="Rhodomonas sp., Strain CCMP768" /LENGTH=176 /DNA_ID=CAMNT_0049512039 /DNA_START=116 /DNA_END=643 /DNA_ORIENTATION=+
MDGLQQGQPSQLALKRIHGEVQALKRDPPDFFRAMPLDSDLLDWHFVLLGVKGSAFEGGLYHGRILLDEDYPMKPPRLLFLTESGRFEVGVPLCLSITTHHPECWQPTWDMAAALTELRYFMLTPSQGALGGLGASEEVQTMLAARSQALPDSLPLAGLSGARRREGLQLHRRLHR